MASSITKDYSQISSITVSGVASTSSIGGFPYVVAGFTSDPTGMAVIVARYGSVNNTKTYSGTISITGSLTSGTRYYAAVGRSSYTAGIIGPETSQGEPFFTSLLYGYYAGKKTITFNANGGSGAPSSVTTYWASNEALTSFCLNAIPSTIPTRSGAEFLGWATSRTATTAEYTAGQVNPIVTSTTLYAVWDVVTPPIKVKVGGAWKTATAIKVKVGGAWKDATGVKIKANGAWKDAT